MIEGKCSECGAKVEAKPFLDADGSGYVMTYVSGFRIIGGCEHVKRGADPASVHIDFEVAERLKS